MAKRVRPSWDEYFLNIAREVAQRSTCISRINGAVLVDDQKKVVSTGYNGWAGGTRNCCDLYEFPDNPCPRLVAGHKTGEGYGNLCKAIHAEANALLQSPADTEDFVLYLYTESIKPNGEHFPDSFCLGCLSNMLNKKISRGVVRSVVGNDIKKFEYTAPDMKNAYLLRSK